MDRRTAYIRRLELASHRQKRLGMLAMFGMAASAVAILMPGPSTMHAPSGVDRGVPAAILEPVAAAQAGAPRRVYPYSIIPGGVADAAELRQVIRNDRVVAMHYAGFDVDKARAITVAKPRAVYVSYRKGDQVFWTKHKVMLAQGETLFTDGENEMRARCANRISDVPQFPVEARGPREGELDLTLDDLPGIEDGIFLPTSAYGLTDIPPGQRFHPETFVNDAGLARPAAPPAAGGRGRPSAPDIDRSDLYDLPGGTLHFESRVPGPDAPAPTPAPEVPHDGVPPVPGAEQPPAPTPAPPLSNERPGVPDDGPPTPDAPPRNELPPGEPPREIEPAPPAPVDVPEPGTLWLSGAAFAGMWCLRRKKTSSIR